MTDGSHLVGAKGDTEAINHEGGSGETNEEQKELLDKMIHISGLIRKVSVSFLINYKGAVTFLRQEYLFVFIFIVAMAIILPFTAEPVSGEFYTTVSFVLGAVTSLASGYVGMMAATYANVRTTKECATSIGNGFVVAYRGGQILGFALVGLALLNLTLLIVVVRSLYDPQNIETEDLHIHTFRSMYEVIAGYGFGGSAVALFGRVGGGIYTKAADVGSDLAGKVVQGLEEDDPSNPGVIADNVGDNVGDIAGMGADLFGSLAESTCAALVVSATSKELMDTEGAVWFPLLITGSGIVVSFVTCLVATNI